MFANHTSNWWYGFCRCKLFVLMAVVCAGAGSASAASAPAPLSGESKVNFITRAVQDFAIGSDSSGNIVLAWVAQGLGLGLGLQRQSDVYVRRYNAKGLALSTELLVNNRISGSQVSPALAVNADGSYIILWGGAGVRARRYSASGISKGLEFQLNSDADALMLPEAVAWCADGGFLVVWSQPDGAANGYDNAVFVRRYDSKSKPIGNAIRVSSSTGVQRGAALSINADGSFVIAWSAEDISGLSRVFAARFSADVQRIGDTFSVSQTAAQFQFQPSVVSRSDGSFTVAWNRYSSDAASYDMLLRRFDVLGQPTTNELLLVAGGKGLLTMDRQGHEIASWSAHAPMADYSTASGLFIRYFDSTGYPVGPAIEASVVRAIELTAGGIVVDAGGNFTVAWKHTDNTFPDYNNDLYFRRFSGLGN